eukprot:scaffold2616_cov63-Phaeocystis_antarctica.AAC.2
MVRAVLLVRRREAIDAATAHGGAARRLAVTVEDTHAPSRHVAAGRGGAEGGEARALLAHPVECSEAHRLGLRRRASAPPWVERKQPPGGGCSGCSGCGGGGGGCGGSVGDLGALPLRRCATTVCGGGRPRRAEGVLSSNAPHLAALRRVRLLHLAHRRLLEVDNVGGAAHHHLDAVLEGRQRRLQLLVHARLLVRLERPAQLDLPDRPAGLGSFAVMFVVVLVALQEVDDSRARAARLSRAACGRRHCRQGRRSRFGRAAGTVRLHNGQRVHVLERGFDGGIIERERRGRVSSQDTDGVGWQASHSSTAAPKLQMRDVGWHKQFGCCAIREA